MSLGVPTADNRNGATNVASLFATLGKSPAGNGVPGVNGRVSSDSQYKGLDWASTLRQSTSLLNEQRSRQPASAGDKAAERVADRATDRKPERGSSTDKTRNTDRTAAGKDRQLRDAKRDVATDDTSSVRDEIDLNVDDDASVALAQNDAGNEDAIRPEDESADIAGEDEADNETADPTTDALALALAGEQAVNASAQLTPGLDAQVQAGQKQGDAQNQTSQAVGQASLQQPATAAVGSAEQLLAGQAQVEGKGDGKAALPAQAANTAAAQAQQNPGLAGASPEQQAASQQQNQQGQSQGQAGQQQAGSQAQAAVPASGVMQQAAALEIQTTTTGSNTQLGVTSGGAAVQTGSPAAITLPAGADPLLNAQAQDDGDPNVARIAQGLRSAVNLKGGAVTIRLNPHELGHVRIEMEIKNGNISAQLQTEQASVRDLLNHQLGKLRETLQARGLHVERLEVNAPSPAEDSSAGRNAQESPNQGRSRGQFFQQRGGSDGQNGSASQNAQNISERKTFGDMLVDMVG